MVRGSTSAKCIFQFIRNCFDLGLPNWGFFVGSFVVFLQGHLLFLPAFINVDAKRKNLVVTVERLD